MLDHLEALTTHEALTLTDLRAEASDLGVLIDEDHVGDEQGYWLLDPVTGEGVWDDENFSTSLEEVASKIASIRMERLAA